MGQLTTAIAGLIIVGIVLFQLYLNISEAIGVGGFWLLFLCILAVPIGAYIYFIYIEPEQEWQSWIRAAPDTGPMRVNVRTEQLTKGFSKTPVYRLHIDVKLSKKDIRAMKNSGIATHSLFDYPHPKFPETQIPYKNIFLFRLKYVDFPDIQELEKGKDELLQSLHFLRSRLDQTNELVREQTRHKGTSETYEI